MPGLPRLAERVHFQKGDAASLNFPDATFDVVVSNLTFHEVKMVKSKIEVLQEALRVVKPGGNFVFIDYFYDERYYGNAAGLELLLWSLKFKAGNAKAFAGCTDILSIASSPKGAGKSWDHLRYEISSNLAGQVPDLHHFHGLLKIIRIGGSETERSVHSKCINAKDQSMEGGAPDQVGWRGADRGNHPTTGKPRAQAWTRTWCVRPVAGVAESSA